VPRQPGQSLPLTLIRRTEVYSVTEFD